MRLPAIFNKSGVDEGRAGAEEEQEEGEGDDGDDEDDEADAVAFVVVVVGVAEEEDEAEEEGGEHGEPAEVAVDDAELEVEEEDEGHDCQHVYFLALVVFPLGIVFDDEVAEHEADESANGGQ